MSFIVPVKGKCPACGAPLCTSDRPDPPNQASERAAIRCVAMNHGCPDPFAATKMLELDHRHVLEQDDHGWLIEHPVSCRLDGKKLLDCAVHKAVSADLDNRSPGVPGRFYVVLSDDSPWGFTTTPVDV